MTCPNCHQETKPGATFCGNCGFQLSGSPQPSQAVSTAQTTQPNTPPSAQPQVVAPASQQPSTQPATPPPPQPTPTAQPQAFQPVYSGANGAFVGSPAGTAPLNTTNPAANTHDNGKAIAAFVLGVLGCVGWLIPLVGVILGILALIFGTTSIKSPRRVFAIIGIILAVPVIAVSIFFWVRAAEQIQKEKSNPISGLTTKSTSSATRTISTACYTTKVPAALTITQTSGSCTFLGQDTTSGEEYEVRVLQVAGLSTANLPQAAQSDAQNVVNSIPGGSISTQGSSTFAGSPDYAVGLSATDGSAGTVAYVYNSTAQGNLVIVFHSQRTGKNFDLTSIENNWTWQ